MSDLIRPALVALGGWIVASLAAGIFVAVWDTSAQTGLSIGRVLWAAIPQILVGVVTAGAAAYAHRRPERDDRRRHALAVLLPAGVLVVVQALLDLIGVMLPWAIAVACVATAVGAVLGWLLVSRVVRQAERAEVSGRYF